MNNRKKIIILVSVLMGSGYSLPLKSQAFNRLQLGNYIKGNIYQNSNHAITGQVLQNVLSGQNSSYANLKSDTDYVSLFDTACTYYQGMTVISGGDSIYRCSVLTHHGLWNLSHFRFFEIIGGTGGFVTYPGENSIPYGSLSPIDSLSFEKNGNFTYDPYKPAFNVSFPSDTSGMQFNLSGGTMDNIIMKNNNSCIVLSSTYSVSPLQFGVIVNSPNSKIGIPNNRVTIGYPLSQSHFQWVDSVGSNFIFSTGGFQINNVKYNWTNKQGEGNTILTNDGKGNLSWQNIDWANGYSSYDARYYSILNPSGYISNISSISAGGDLSGNYPNPIVANMLGNPIPANASGYLYNNGSGVLSWGIPGGLLPTASEGVLVNHSSISSWSTIIYGSVGNQQIDLTTAATDVKFWMDGIVINDKSLNKGVITCESMTAPQVWQFPNNGGKIIVGNITGSPLNPTTPVSYLQVMVNGTTYYMPLYQ